MAWSRAHKQKVPIVCGSCRKPIPGGALLMTIDSRQPPLVRCQPCGEPIFGGPAPEVLEAPPVITGPQPTLGLDLHRGHDFVTPRQIARSVNFNAHRDARMRQTGEEG